MSEDEAFEKKWWQTRVASGCDCQICHDRNLAVWRAGVEHMRSSTRGLYCKCPGCGEFLAIPVKPHYCNVVLHVSSALTRADVEAWPIEKLRERVAVEVIGAVKGPETSRLYHPAFDVGGEVYSPPLDSFQPDVNPVHNQMVWDAMRAKGWLPRIQPTDSLGTYTSFGFWPIEPSKREGQRSPVVPLCMASELVLLAMTRAAYLAVNGL